MRRMEIEQNLVAFFGAFVVFSSILDFESDAMWRRYDTIWAQWVLLYLTDDDLVLFLERCKKGLTRRGKSSMCDGIFSM